MTSTLNAISRSRTARVAGSTAALAVALGGASLLVAPSAQASTAYPVRIAAPATVTSGQEFTLKCAIKPLSLGKSWKGATAILHEKGLPIHATRYVSPRGGCSMKVILNATGKHRLRVVVIGAQNVIKSKIINITVN